MSYYWFNREELLQKAKDRYHNGGGKKEAGDYYIVNKDVFFLKKANSKYKNLSGKEEEAKKEYSRNRYKNMEKNASQKSVKK